ncbi:hypothetical protein OV079_45850 [Nannocystis pusilla]|uniref:Uncharacterized protein n=1 Tax=Nannocystis pusilla TaxID=889268 RepID=A0A9X3F752_9BACT|nr:hypothetical protein [Nannocystis pusilla]MCY1012741.1 hypothetical protein [Nannocystis pusilla]
MSRGPRRSHLSLRAAHRRATDLQRPRAALAASRPWHLTPVPWNIPHIACEPDAANEAPPVMT